MYLKLGLDRSPLTDRPPEDLGKYDDVTELSQFAFQIYEHSQRYHLRIFTEGADFACTRLTRGHITELIGILSRWAYEKPIRFGDMDAEYFDLIELVEKDDEEGLILILHDRDYDISLAFADTSEVKKFSSELQRTLGEIPEEN